MTRLSDQSAQQEAFRRSYGGSDSTAPSFNRPQYVKYNSLLKSRDFGRLDNFGATLTGVVGGHTGRSTLFFRVETSAPAKLGVLKRMSQPITDRTISVGILDADHNPLPLNDDGFTYANQVHNTAASQTPLQMPPGVYYFTVSTNQWRETPFSIDVLVQRYLECRGVAQGHTLPTLRLALVKLIGAAGGSCAPILLVTNPDQVVEPAGAALLSATPSLTLAIMRGVAIGRMEPYARLQQNYRIEGVATGTAVSIATMTARRPYGYGY